MTKENLKFLTRAKGSVRQISSRYQFLMSEGGVGEIDGQPPEIREEGKEKEDYEMEVREDAEGERGSACHNWKNLSTATSLLPEGIYDADNISLKLHEQRRERLLMQQQADDDERCEGIQVRDREAAENFQSDHHEQGSCSSSSVNLSSFNSQDSTLRTSSSSLAVSSMMDDSTLLRDSPHPRHLCVVFPFIPPPCLSNTAHCNKCWCYSCEELAPCSLWGTGLNSSDHCNASAASWYWARQKVMGSQKEARATDNQSLQLAISARPSSMSGFSHGLYGPSFCPLNISSSLESLSDSKLLREEPQDTECYPSCSPTSSIVLVANRPRTDPSADGQWFEFGTVHIPVKLWQSERALEDLIEGFDKFSLDIFSHILGERKASDLERVELAEDESRLPQHQALLGELMANEAQGQLQVIVSIDSGVDDRNSGTAHIRIFFRKARGDEHLCLKELLRELFPENASLQRYLLEVDEMRKWAETSDDWTSVAGLLRDLDSNGYAEATQPPGLSVPLRAYQRQSLQFMLDAEHRDGGLLSVNYHQLPNITASGQSLMYSASLGHLMEAKESETVRGGFLCEEMGLGKTIEILALILANPCPVDKCPVGSSKGTLVVCPVSIVGQWANEVKSKLAANLSIYMYHGSKRIRDPKKLAKYDIVITTYATLGSDFSKATQATRHGANFAEHHCPLLTVNWWRVVLDESHTVKDPAPLHSRACSKLKAERRWCCTGTPINTSIFDLYGQFLFLKLEPLDNKNVFRRKIGRPYERQCKSDDHTVLLWTLNKIMIRHTKQQKFNGRELLRLPPKSEQDIPVFFTSEERIAYEAVYQKVISKFEQFRCWGPTVVSKNILQIMSLLLPLRRLCSGGFVSNFDLNMSKRERSPGGAIEVSVSNSPTRSGIDTDSLDDADGECGICFDLMECPTKTPCGHWFCCECVMSTIGIGSQGLCPICRCLITASQLTTFQPKLKGTVMTSNLDPTGLSAGSLLEDDNTISKGVQMNSKLRTLLADLNKVREENPGAKVLIFSQFMQTIAWLKTEFKKQNINYRFISGDMPMKKRAQAIEAFQKDPPTTVFLLSIRTGAVGITLTAASHVYMLEPCLNPALEEQAVGRCWRMGQERPVIIKRLYVENSVEANILKLLRSRSVSFLASSDSPDSESSSRPSKTGKSSVADVAGCIRTDKQNLRLNEFEILFS